MKTPEDVINRFINEENVKFNQERDDWVIEAMEEYAKLYHESKVKKLNIPAVSGSPSFEDWLNKYFETPKMKMMYKRKDGKGEYDMEKLIRDYKRAFRQS
jgi:hypothetical protein